MKKLISVFIFLSLLLSLHSCAITQRIEIEPTASVTLYDKQNDRYTTLTELDKISAFTDMLSSYEYKLVKKMEDEEFVYKADFYDEEKKWLRVVYILSEREIVCDAWIYTVYDSGLCLDTEHIEALFEVK